MSDTAIILVNWNGRHHLDVCFSSLFNQTYQNFIVFFVDNGSTDDSVPYVREKWPRVNIIAEKKNVGFAEGNNIGIRATLKDPNIQYIVTLNNDTEQKSDWLEKLVNAIQRDTHIGAVCSKTMFFDQRGIIDSAGDFLLSHTLKVVTRGYKQRDDGRYDTSEECFSCRAAAAVYRREMLEDIQMGGDFFDRRFFAYIEDVDLSVRARLFGWKINYEPQAVVFHKVASTSKRLSHMFRRYHAGRNRLLMAIKNYPISFWPAVARERTSVDNDYRLSPIDTVVVYAKIIGCVLMMLPQAIRQRRWIQKHRRVSIEEIKGWTKRFSI